MIMLKRFIIILLCTFMLSCARLDRYEWKLIPNTEKIYSNWSMTSDKDGNLWFIPRFGQIGGLYRVSASGHQDVIIPYLGDDAPRNICAENASVISFISFEGQVVRINPQQGKDALPIILKDEKKYQGARCLVLENGNILVWRDNWIENISSNGISEISFLDTNVDVEYIALDLHSRPVALTRNGQMYLFTDNKWVLDTELKIDQDSDEIFYRTYWANKNLWIATNKRLVKWNIQDQSYEVILSDLDNTGELNSYVHVVFEHPMGKTWIISSCDILQLDNNGNRINIDIPGSRIWDAVYISSLGRVYITNDSDTNSSGILYLELSKYKLGNKQ